MIADLRRAIAQIKLAKSAVPLGYAGSVVTMDALHEATEALMRCLDVAELADSDDDLEAMFASEEAAMEVPDDFPVKAIDEYTHAERRATCGKCGRTWDDAIVTSYTPAPSARCPFEAFH